MLTPELRAVEQALEARVVAYRVGPGGGVTFDPDRSPWEAMGAWMVGETGDEPAERPAVQLGLFER